MKASYVLLPSVLLLSACGQQVSGLYTGQEGSFLESMNFKSGGKVELTFMGGTGEGTYEIEGNKVKVTNNGETQLLTIDADGCLDGGRRIGKYCK